MDLTSALYLGMDHPSVALRPWDRLTTGRPAALGRPAASHRLAAALALLLRVERAVLARSTLHAFVDVVATLVGPGDQVLVDGGSYPVGLWAVARTRVPGVVFPHHDPDALARRLASAPVARGRPVVVVDGWCPGCGGPAPLREYLRLVRTRGGRLLVDDTQALGVLGAAPDPRHPLGRGGGGVAAWSGVQDPALVVVSSLAKGFGVPIAVVGGGGREIGRVARDGPTASHASPPSAADLRAAEHALVVNRSRGDRIRDVLARLVRRLRRRARQLGVRLEGGAFPVQSLPAMEERTARAVHRRLADGGVRAVLQRPRCRPGATVTFLVTARHRPAEMDRAAEAMAAALDAAGRPPSEGGVRHATD